MPAAGTLTVFSPPGGPGVRVDTYGRPGLVVGARYDSLLAKVITHVHEPSFPAALRKMRTALAEFCIEGVRTNIGLLRELLSDSMFQSGWVTTGFLDEKLPELAGAALVTSTTRGSRRSSSTRVRRRCVPSWPGRWSR